MDTIYKGKVYTAAHIAECREWISDCEWPDLGQDEIDNLSPERVLKGVDRHHFEGLAGFDFMTQPENA